MVSRLLDVAALNLECGADLWFSLEYVREDGTRDREPLAACRAGRFEEAVPVRSFHWAKGAAHFPGLWWSSTTLAHVGFESWLERDGLPTELPVSYRQNCGGDLIFSLTPGSDTGAGRCLAWPGVAAGLLRVLRAGLRRG